MPDDEVAMLQQRIADLEAKLAAKEEPPQPQPQPAPQPEPKPQPYPADVPGEQGEIDRLTYRMTAAEKRLNMLESILGQQYGIMCYTEKN